MIEKIINNIKNFLLSIKHKKELEKKLKEIDKNDPFIYK